MIKTILTTTALALIAMPALAETQTQTRSNIKTRGDTGTYVEYSKDAETVTKKEIKRSTEKAKQAVKRTADKVSDAVKPADAAKPAAAGLAVSEAKIAQDDSAEHMIGKPVLNAAGERVGSVHDVILAKNGQAKKLIVADGGMMSLGDKKAAFDYSVISSRDAKGALQTSITEEQINNATPFSYKAEDAAEKKSGKVAAPAVVVKAADDLSLRDVIGAAVVDQSGKKIGAVKDIAIDGNRAGKVIVAYDQILGLGGKKVSLAYGDVAFNQNDGGKLNLRLNETQAAQLVDAKRAN